MLLKYYHTALSTVVAVPPPRGWPRPDASPDRGRRPADCRPRPRCL